MIPLGIRGRLLGTLLAGLAACAPTGAPRGELAGAAPGPPMRVVPTNATAVDYVLDLIEPARVVALPDTVEDYATVSLELERWPAERRFSQFSAEVLLDFDPDLVIVSPWQDQSTIERLSESGVRVVELPKVESLDDIRASIRVAAEALQAEERAQLLLADFDARVEALERAARARGRVAGLVYTNYGSGGWAAGGGTTAHHMLLLAGVDNVAAEAGRQGHDMLGIEELLSMDPDILVISQASRDYGVTRAFLEQEPALASLGAIAEGRIVELPAALFSTASHHLLDAAEALAREVDALVASGRLQPRARAALDVGDEHR